MFSSVQGPCELYRAKISIQLEASISWQPSSLLHHWRNIAFFKIFSMVQKQQSHGLKSEL